MMDKVNTSPGIVRRAISGRMGMDFGFYDTLYPEGVGYNISPGRGDIS
jgi:hypothetical protein